MGVSKILSSELQFFSSGAKILAIQNFFQGKLTVSYGGKGRGGPKKMSAMGGPKMGLFSVS